jgi:hypothetical protein
LSPLCSVAAGAQARGMTNRMNRKMLLNALRRAASILADVAYGIDAGSAIRHGLPVPPRRGRAGRLQSSGRIVSP